MHEHALLFEHIAALAFFTSTGALFRGRSQEGMRFGYWGEALDGPICIHEPFAVVNSYSGHLIASHCMLMHAIWEVIEPYKGAIWFPTFFGDRKINDMTSWPQETVAVPQFLIYRPLGLLGQN